MKIKNCDKVISVKSLEDVRNEVDAKLATIEIVIMTYENMIQVAAQGSWYDRMMSATSELFERTKREILDSICSEVA